MNSRASPSPETAVVVDAADLPVEGWTDAGRGAVTWRTLLSADRTASEALTLGVAEVIAEAPAGEARLHRHAQPEAYYILAGEGVLHVEGKEWPLRPGVAAFIPGGAWHAARAVGPVPLRLLYVFPAASFDEVIYEFRDGG